MPRVSECCCQRYSTEAKGEICWPLKGDSTHSLSHDTIYHKLYGMVIILGKIERVGPGKASGYYFGEESRGGYTQNDRCVG